jgi:hypothetical protein
MQNLKNHFALLVKYAKRNKYVPILLSKPLHLGAREVDLKDFLTDMKWNDVLNFT